MRVVTGAHYGLRDWLAQRVTAAVMAIYTLMLAAVLLVSPPQDYASFKTLFGNQWMRVGSFLFLLSLFWHTWVGMRNILMDYVHAASARLTLEILVILSLLFYAAWSVEILWIGEG
ncbi:MAG TPA: succinate dehydrogenase, hydrophobic membrane anchor protein [Xanthomonadales bacterium]|nr:succinate dehydrogenase, hydrophobic membrane anchor protein [Xanthomonadales bacterium]